MPARVLLLETEFGVGGTEAIVQALATGIDRQRFMPAVAALDGRGIHGERLRQAGIPVFDLKSYSHFQLPQAIHNLRTIIKSEGIRLIHAHLFHATVVGCLAAGGLPVCASTHIAERRFRPWRFWIDRLLGGRIAKRVCVSQAVMDFQQAKTSLARENFRVIRNGIDLSNFTPSTQEQKTVMRQKLGLPQDKTLVGSFGRFDWQKGHDIFIAAAAKMMGRFPKAHFVVSGYGGEESRLRQQAASLHLGNQISFLCQPEANEVYAALDLFAFPSRYEGWGLVLCEAMACGLPTVASNLPILREVAGESACVRFCQPENPEALAEGLSDLLKSPEEQRRLALAALNRAQSFSAQRMIAEHEELYQELAGL